MSQPQQLQWIKEQQPEIFAQIQARVAEGRWECQGCMWVGESSNRRRLGSVTAVANRELSDGRLLGLRPEPDTNVTAGESFIRQTLHGQRFWRENFGLTVNHLWEPDVFGYTAALPQASATPFADDCLPATCRPAFPHVDAAPLRRS